MEFEVLINEEFMQFCSDPKLNPVKNKRVFSLANGFENGKWRTEEFNKFVWDNLAETALSKQERSALFNSSYSTLVEAAKNLRLIDENVSGSKDGFGEASELAEIVLYGVMKKYYGALPVVPKIFYKQNVNDNAKGADSVHVVVNGSEFSLWYGEAKFYNSIEDARLNTIIKSVGNSLGLKKIQKENKIVTNTKDLDDLVENKELLQKIKDTLSESTSIDMIKPILNIPILLLHECEITKSAKRFDEEYKDKIISYHKDRANAYFKKQVKSLSQIDLYEKIKFHLILIPVPNKSDLITGFVSKAKLFRA